MIVVTGAGNVFSAGFDLKEFQQIADPAHSKKLWASSDRFHRTILECPLPTIAAVNGPALAGGFDLAVLCDLRIASREASFAHPEMTFSDVVYGPLRELVGGAMARELVFTLRIMPPVPSFTRSMTIWVFSRGEIRGNDLGQSRLANCT